MSAPALLLFSLLLAAAAAGSFAARDFQAELAEAKSKGHGGSAGAGGVPGIGSDVGGFFGPGNGGGFSIPGIGSGWGAGYGGPAGGYARGGVVRPSVVCSDRGPCYKKKLICPAKCFSSYSRSGKGFGGGGGGGGCVIDCKKRCAAYC